MKRTYLLEEAKVVAGALAVVLGVSSWAGCSADSEAGGSMDAGASDGSTVSIGPQGATVVGPAGAVLQVPPGALVDATPITIEVVSTGYPGLPSDLLLRSPVFAFRPHGLTFTAPVTVRVPHAGVDRTMVGLYTAPPNGSWTRVNDVTVGSDFTQASVTHFSFFANTSPLSLPDAGSDVSDETTGGTVVGSSGSAGGGGAGGASNAGTGGMGQGGGGVGGAGNDADASPPMLPGCTNGMPTDNPPGASDELVTTATAPTELLVDANALYFVDGSTIFKVDKTGGTPSFVAAGNDIAQDGTYLYWRGSTAIMRMVKAGGSPETVACGNPAPLDTCYTYSAGTADCGTPPNTCYFVYRTPLDGSAPPAPITDGGFPWSQIFNPPVTLIDDTSFVYWNGPGVSLEPNVLQVDKNTGATVVLASEGKGPTTLDATTVYAISGSIMFSVPKFVYAYDKVTHAKRSVLIVNDPRSNDFGEIAVDDTYLYWSGSGLSPPEPFSGTKRIPKCASAGTPGTTISSLVLKHMAGDDQFTYGVVGSEIRRLSKF